MSASANVREGVDAALRASPSHRPAKAGEGWHTPSMDTSKRRDLVGAGFLVLGVVLCFGVDSGPWGRAIFLAFGLVGSLIAHGVPRPTLTTTRTRLGIGLVLYALAAAIAVLAEPTLLSWAAVIAICVIAIFIAHGLPGRSASGEPVHD